MTNRYDPDKVIDALLDDVLSDEQFASLDQALREDPAYAERFAQAMLIDGCLKARFEQQSLVSAIRQDERALERDSDLLLALLDDYNRHDVEPVKLDTVKPGKRRKTRQAAESMTLGEGLSIVGYLLAKSVRTRAGASALAAAAVVVIGVALFLALSPNGDPQHTPNAPTASTQSMPRGSEEPGPLGPPQTNIVATLTAEHNAVWDIPGAEGVLAPGANLHPGTRLTLTQGFAEITTNRGAIAIVQAPATIELLNNDNAIHLHTGKLVGICETPSSKGFVVRTPHIDITDLGTRFGVDATKKRITKVHVFEGQVQVAYPFDAAGQQQPARLVAGQALKASNTAISAAAYTPQSFDDALALAPNHDAMRPQLEGGPVAWQGKAPRDLNLHQHEADALQVFLERQSLVLDADTPVDIKPGETWPHERGFGKASVPTGTAVDVYLLHLDPVGDAESRKVPIQCEIRFERPIVGLIGAQSTLRQTDKSLGRPSTIYPVIEVNEATANTGGSAGLDLDAMFFKDTATISADGLTLTLELSAANLDQLRVLVQNTASSNSLPSKP